MTDEDYFDWTEKIFDVDNAFLKPEALKGIRVIDLSHVILGPETASLLADFGAEVIKIERPGTGEFNRSFDLWCKFWKNNSLGVMWIQRNKYFLGLNLKHPKGREVLYELVKRSDVVIENYAPGVVDRLKISYRHLKEINPRIIYVSLSGYGQWGERWKWPSWDAAGQAASGVAAISGYEERTPMKLPYYVGDSITAAAAFMATLAALYHREKTGEGQYIDVTQAETFVRLMSHIWTYVDLKNEDWKRTGNKDVSMLANGYKALDGRMVTITALTDEQFSGLCKAMGREDLIEDERFSTISSRLKPENREELEKIIEKWVSETNSQDIIELSAKYGFSAGVVRDTYEVYTDEHLRARKTIWIYDDPLFGEMLGLVAPMKLSKTPPRIKWTLHPVGYHNRYILKKILGLKDDEVEELEKEGVIGYWEDIIGRTPPPGFDPEKDPVFRW